MFFFLEYPKDYPLKELRLVPAFCGSLIVPMVYQIAVELGFSRWSAMLAGTFILLGNCSYVAMDTTWNVFSFKLPLMFLELI